MTTYYFLTWIMALCLLFFGRKLFWLFLGIVGFALGVDFSLAVFGQITNIALLGWALLFGVLGAVLTMVLQRFAIVLGGFIGGGYLAFHLAVLFGFQETASWALFVVGAILGAVLFSFAFDWALIVLSALIGAIMIAQLPVVSQGVRNAIFILCAILGFIIQAKIFMDFGGNDTKKA